MNMTMLFKPDHSQLAAIDHALKHKISVITGNAGTGKTSTIEWILPHLNSYNLCSFTGKAAARIREKSKVNAYTIHKTLEWQGTKFVAGKFTNTAIIIDEASMVPSDLMYEIIKRNPQKLILIGDPAQLPPVGIGDAFHDIIKYKPGLVSELTVNHRNKAAICSAALQVRDGTMPPLFDQTFGEKPELWTITNTGAAAKTQEKLLEVIKKGIIDFQKDIILVPRNGELDSEKEYPECTVKGLNLAIKEIVNPSDTKFCVNDRVINTENTPTLDIWNGTTGTIEAIDIGGNIYIRTDTKTCVNGEQLEITKVPKNLVKNIELAYALTVHKSQGSEYRKVFFISLFRDAHSLLERSLIYTAVTRAREECHVIGEVLAFKAGIQKVANKKTVLQQLLRADKQ